MWSGHIPTEAAILILQDGASISLLCRPPFDSRRARWQRIMLYPYHTISQPEVCDCRVWSRLQSVLVPCES